MLMFPVIVIVTEPPEGKAGTLVLTLLPETFTVAGHSAPPVALAQLALTPVTPVGTLSLKVAPSAALGPALAITTE